MLVQVYYFKDLYFNRAKFVVFARPRSCFSYQDFFASHTPQRLLYAKVKYVLSQGEARPCCRVRIPRPSIYMHDSIIKSTTQVQSWKNLQVVRSLSEGSLYLGVCLFYYEMGLAGLW